MVSVTILDFAILLFVGAVAVVSARRGFAATTCSVVGILLALLAGILGAGMGTPTLISCLKGPAGAALEARTGLPDLFSDGAAEAAAQLLQALLQHKHLVAAVSALEQLNVRRLDMTRLNQMIDYCTQDRCLRGTILRYFGEKAASDCGDCGHCTGGRYDGLDVVTRVRKKPAAAARPAGPAPKHVDAPAGGDLFEQLRAVRMALAKAQRVPPYVICSDATLQSMARIRPQTKEGMLSVNGMGEIKTARYGEAFLKVLRAYAAQEKRMRSQVAAIAREAQTSARSKPTAAPLPSRPVTARPAPPPPPSSLPELSDTPGDIADAYLSGMTIQQIADELGASPARIRQQLADMDLIF